MKRTIKQLLFASAFLAAALTVRAGDEFEYDYCDGGWEQQTGENPTYCPNMYSPSATVTSQGAISSVLIRP